MTLKFKEQKPDIHVYGDDPNDVLAILTWQKDIKTYTLRTFHRGFTVEELRQIVEVMDTSRIHEAEIALNALRPHRP